MPTIYSTEAPDEPFQVEDHIYAKFSSEGDVYAYKGSYPALINTINFLQGTPLKGVPAEPLIRTIAGLQKMGYRRPFPVILHLVETTTAILCPPSLASHRDLVHILVLVKYLRSNILLKEVMRQISNRWRPMAESARWSEAERKAVGPGLLAAIKHRQPNEEVYILDGTYPDDMAHSGAVQVYQLDGVWFHGARNRLGRICEYMLA